MAIYYEDMMVEKSASGMSYRVSFVEEDVDTFYIKSKLVDNITSATDAEPELVAIGLACVEYARKSTATCETWPKQPWQPTRPMQSIKDEELVQAFVNLLKSKPIEYLLGVIRFLKYHQLKLIFLSDNPLETLESYL